MVNALLADASNKLQHRVQVKLAAAEAMIERRYQTEGEAVISALRAVSKSGLRTDEQAFYNCPVCGSDGIATGSHNIWGPPLGEPTGIPMVDAEDWFTAQTFHCSVCDLRLDSAAEIDAAGIETAWEVEDVGGRDREEPRDDGDVAYERWREERDGL